MNSTNLLRVVIGSGLGVIGLSLVACYSSSEYRGISAKPQVYKNRTVSPAMAMSMPMVPMVPFDVAPRGNRYGKVKESAFIETAKQTTSTFSIDVDTAAYAQMRGLINDGNEVPDDLVRIEEMLNYFSYDYTAPAANSKAPFTVSLSGITCPWEKDDVLVRIGVQGKKLNMKARKATNLVFLIDTSGSMYASDKLPLLQKSFSILLKELNGNDTVSIVTYAGATSVALEPTSATAANKRKIQAVLEDLEASGSTNGAGGIQLAYAAAQKRMKRGGVNRVILATDGDFNVGVSNSDALVDLVKKKARSGIELSVLGFGHGNLNDDMMEAVTNAGNGNYSYIDTELEAKRALVSNFGGTMQTIAKDVKIQTVFDPKTVKSYRLIGYSNRRLANEDFANDKVDAGEIGLGHSVTALYQVKLKSADAKLATVGALGKVRLRYKAPQGGASKLISSPISGPALAKAASRDDQFAAAVALFGLTLRDSQYRGTGDSKQVIQLAKAGLTKTDREAKEEFIKLVRKAD